MSRPVVVIGRVGALRSQIGAAQARVGAQADAAAPAPAYGGAGDGPVDQVMKYVDPGTTSAAPTFGGAALGAVLAPMVKTSPYVGAAAGAALGNFASTVLGRSEGGLQADEVTKYAATTAAYALTGAGVAYATGKAKPLTGALLGLGIPVLAFAVYRAFTGSQDSSAGFPVAYMGGSYRRSGLY